MKKETKLQELERRIQALEQRPIYYPVYPIGPTCPTQPWPVTQPNPNITPTTQPPFYPTTC